MRVVINTVLVCATAWAMGVLYSEVHSMCELPSHSPILFPRSRPTRYKSRLVFLEESNTIPTTLTSFPGFLHLLVFAPMHRGGTALLLLCLTVSTNGRLKYGEDLGTRLIAPSPVWRTFKDDFLPTFADFNQAALLFGGLRKADPYRLTNMDIYSNVLFVLVSEH